MNVRPLPITGALLIVPRAFADERGYFKETFSATRYAEAGILETFVQDNVSSSDRDVLRGLHADPRMAKIVQVLAGSGFDVIADIRPESPTYGQWYGECLRAGEHKQVYIPAGCLHGFLSLEDGTLLTYKQSALYDQASETGIAWNDPTLAIAWPLAGRIPRLSPKDAANPSFETLAALGPQGDSPAV
ncbi:MAG: dTDP-4-dehydrorhamnose 3,5-epimerase [Candidatus Eremiobacteraeota bacterium]|nr:dTDP-4-dehydrorhamnose 3,5-epimerase [Candidatus Eremiobacteraeota bacterium]